MFKAWYGGKEKRLCLKCLTEQNQGWVDEETRDKRLFKVPDFVCSMCGFKKGIPDIVKGRDNANQG